jgi:hypothetical protein
MIDNNLLISIILYFISIYLASKELQSYKKDKDNRSYYLGYGYLVCASIYLINTILRIVFLQG